MRIYEHRTDMTTAAGEVETVTLPLAGGVLRTLLIRAATDTTVFRAELVDAQGVTRVNFGFHRGEINTELYRPFHRAVTVKVTNASPDDTFTIIGSFQD